MPKPGAAVDTVTPRPGDAVDVVILRPGAVAGPVKDPVAVLTQ